MALRRHAESEPAGEWVPWGERHAPRRLSARLPEPAQRAPRPAL